MAVATGLCCNSCSCVAVSVAAAVSVSAAVAAAITVGAAVAATVAHSCICCCALYLLLTPIFLEPKLLDLCGLNQNDNQRSQQPTAPPSRSRLPCKVPQSSQLELSEKSETPKSITILIWCLPDASPQPHGISCRSMLL